MLRTRASGLAQPLDQHLLLVEHGVDRERDALVAVAEDQGRACRVRSRPAAPSGRLEHIRQAAPARSARPLCASVSRPSTVCTSAGRKRVHALDLRGRHDERSGARTSTRTPRKVASVSGSVMRDRGARAALALDATRPPSFSAFSRTIASPRPRPESCGDHRAGRQIRFEHQRAAPRRHPCAAAAVDSRAPRHGLRAHARHVDARAVVADRRSRPGCRSTLR